MEKKLDIEINSGSDVPEELVLRAIGVGDLASVSIEIRRQIKDLVEFAREISQPQVLYTDIGFHLEKNKIVKFDGGYEICSNLLYNTLSNCDGAIIGLLTLGSDIDIQVNRLMQNEDVFFGYVLDSVSSLLIEQLSERLWHKLKSKYSQQQIKVTSFVSPGSLKFPLKYQKEIFSILDASRIGVKLMDSCFMKPAKSLSVILGYGKQILGAKFSHDCAQCGMKDCLLKDIHKDSLS